MTETSLADKARQQPELSFSFGLHRLGYATLAHPAIAAVLIVALAIFAAFGLGRLKVDDSPEANLPQTVFANSDGSKVVNGIEGGPLRPVGHVSKLPGGITETGPLGPIEFLKTIRESEIVLWTTKKQPDGTTVYSPKPTSGEAILRPGNSPTFQGLAGSSAAARWNFVSLMLALFCGTASLPHILIRYYTVKDQASARKSTVVGIASIGFFYVLTL